MMAFHCGDCGVVLSGGAYVVIPLINQHWIDQHGESYSDDAFLRDLDECEDDEEGPE
jgi:hypothetical protein